MIEYIPLSFTEVNGLPSVPTSWNGLEKVIPDIIQRFALKTDIAVEFGVWHGYSTAALANNFKKVIGVDTFVGDIMTGTSDPMIATTRNTLSPWPNIELVESRFYEYDMPWCDLCHIDIVHTYEDTFACGLFASKKSTVLLFHDTESFPEVKMAVTDLAEMSGRTFYNYDKCHGLGILVKK